MMTCIGEYSPKFAFVLLLCTAIGVLADALRRILGFARGARDFSCPAISRKVPGTFPD